MKIICVIFAVALLGACTRAPGPNLSAPAEESSFAVATVAPLNSFSFESAPLYTRVTMQRYQALRALKLHKITADQAQAVQDEADVARASLDAAQVACSEDRISGKCTRSLPEAEKYLQLAAQQIASIKVGDGS